jgi:hypothetical protein
MQTGRHALRSSAKVKDTRELGWFVVMMVQRSGAATHRQQVVALIATELQACICDASGSSSSGSSSIVHAAWYACVLTLFKFHSGWHSQWHDKVRNRSMATGT